AQAILHSTLVPSAMELLLPDGRAGTLAVLLEGVEPGVEGQSRVAQMLLSEHGRASTLDHDAATALWEQLRVRPWSDGAAGLKLRAPIAALADLLEETATVAGRAGLTLRVQAHAGSGIAHAGLAGGDGDVLAGSVEAIRQAAERREGSALLLHGPPELR